MYPKMIHKLLLFVGIIIFINFEFVYCNSTIINASPTTPQSSANLVNNNSTTIKPLVSVIMFAVGGGNASTTSTTPTKSSNFSSSATTTLPGIKGVNSTTTMPTIINLSMLTTTTAKLINPLSTTPVKGVTTVMPQSMGNSTTTKSSVLITNSTTTRPPPLNLLTTTPGKNVVTLLPTTTMASIKSGSSAATTQNLINFSTTTKLPIVNILTTTQAKGVTFTAVMAQSSGNSTTIKSSVLINNSTTTTKPTSLNIPFSTTKLPQLNNPTTTPGKGGVTLPTTMATTKSGGSSATTQHLISLSTTTIKLPLVNISTTTKSSNSVVNASSTKPPLNLPTTTMPPNGVVTLKTTQQTKPPPPTSYNNNSFTCYHGEGYVDKYNLSMAPMDCPTQKCVIIFTYCDDYWATTCYDETNRMLLLKKFKTAERLSKSRQFVVSFCNKTNCNKDNVMAPYSPQLMLNPTPYYPLSYPIQQKHHLWHKKQKIENSVTFETKNNEDIIFTGIAGNDGTTHKVWMEFRIYCAPEVSSGVFHVRYTFNLENAEFVASDGTLFNIIENDATVVAGGKMNVSILAKEDFYTISVNGKENQVGYGTNNPNCSKMVIYGGQWDSIDAYTRDNKTLVTMQKLSFIPNFEPDSSSKYESCGADDLKAMVPDINVKYASIKNSTITNALGSMIKVELINPLQPYGLADIEFRKSLCEFSDLIKIQIRQLSIGRDTRFQYFTAIWTRKNYLWSKFDDDQARSVPTTICNKYYVGISSNDSIMFYCDNSTIFTIPIKGAYAMAQYSAQSIKKQFACFH